MSLKKIPRTLVWSLLLFGLISGGLEMLARTDAAGEKLLTPSTGSSHRQFDLQLQKLEHLIDREGNIDCLFIGSSMTLYGINPEVFTAAYAQQTGETLTCFNFGLWWLTADNQARIVDILVKKYQPDMVIIGIAVRDFYPQNTPDSDILTVPWSTYWRGDFNLEGWLTEQSQAFRTYQAYERWRFYDYKSFRQGQKNVESANAPTTAYGFFPAAPADVAMLTIPAWMQRVWIDVPWFFHVEANPLDADSVAGWEQVLNTLPDKTRLFAVEMPAHPAYFYGLMPDEGGFLLQIGQAGCERGIPFWRTYPVDLNLYDDSQWHDHLHLNASGAAIFSEWLGEQIGTFMKSGESPCNDIALADRPANWGLSVEAYADYMVDEVPWLTAEKPAETVRIVNPAINNRATTSVQTLYGLSLTADNQDSVFAFIKTLERVSFPTENPDLQDWLTTLDPAFLNGIEGDIYLLYGENWIRWIDNETYAHLSNPAYYEIVYEWADNPDLPHYYLYRVKK